MKINRTQNATRNIIFGLLKKIYEIIVPFLLRTALIYYMGAQYLGLNSLFSSVLSVLNLAELGVGSAMVYSMYRPIVEDDEETICALMGLYRKYYRIIGLVILCVGTLLTPALPRIIKVDTVPSDVNVYALYFINLGATVLTYWLFAYKNCLLSAHQRIDITNKITMIGSTITYLFQFGILLFLRNFYLYSAIYLFVDIVNNIVTAWVVNRMYPQYHPKGTLNLTIVKEINQRVKDLFTSKVGSVVYDSVDTIVISAYLGLKVLAIYQNYFYILTAITGFVNVIFSACTAGIGNSLIVESREKNVIDLHTLTFIICWIGGFCSTCFLCLYQPFMKVWMGKSMMLSFYAVICFSVYFFVRQINSVLNLYKDASGMWHTDKWRPLSAALTNLVLNIILVQFIGIYGVLLSTVLAILLVGEPWLLYNLFTNVFDYKYLKRYLFTILKYTIVSVIVAYITYLICSRIYFQDTILIAIRLIICLVIPNFIYFIVYWNTKEFHQSMNLANKILKGRLYRVLPILER